MIGKFVLVRSVNAGVHCGYLVSLDNGNAFIKNARNVWRWSGANTLNELAKHGANEEYTRISEEIDYGYLVLGVCQIIPCSKEAEENLKKSRWA